MDLHFHHNESVGDFPALAYSYLQKVLLAIDIFFGKDVVKAKYGFGRYDKWTLFLRHGVMRAPYNVTIMQVVAQLQTMLSNSKLECIATCITPRQYMIVSRFIVLEVIQGDNAVEVKFGNKQAVNC